ncbi:MAG: lipopolysaccharide core heptose(I) kinase RfaP [Cellvibrionaceae bacterium]
MKIILRDAFKATWSEQNVFDEVQKVKGDIVRDKEGRQTMRFEFGDAAYYLKHHTGIGWGEIIKSFSQLKMPVIGAANEWEAINKLTELGVHTLDAVGYGIRGVNPAKTESFLITKELTGTLSLAKYCEDWPKNPPSFVTKQRLIKSVATIAKKLHDNGMNHRDLYICHFLLRLDSIDQSNPILHLVDLHRAQNRQAVPHRWLVKDVASIYFSAMDIGLTKRDVIRFMKIYFGDSPRKILKEKRMLLNAIRARAEKLYRRDFKREAPVIL